MPTENHWRAVAQPRPDANPWSLLEYRAPDRMSELLLEAELERLTGVARGDRHSAWPQRFLAVASVPAAARSVLAVFARRLNPRPGCGAR